MKTESDGSEWTTDKEAHTFARGSGRWRICKIRVSGKVDKDKKRKRRHIGRSINLKTEWYRKGEKKYISTKRNEVNIRRKGITARKKERKY